MRCKTFTDKRLRKCLFDKLITDKYSSSIRSAIIYELACRNSPDPMCNALRDNERENLSATDPTPNMFAKSHAWSNSWLSPSTSHKHRFLSAEHNWLDFQLKIRSPQHVSTFVLKLMIFWSSTFPIICRHTFPQLASKAGRCNADNWQAIDLSLLRRRRRRRPRLRETCACVRVEPSRHYWIYAEIVRSSVPRNTRKQTWLIRRTQPQANIGWCSIAFQYLASLQNAWQFVKQIFYWVNYAIVDVKLCNRRCFARFRTRPFCK